MLSREWKVAEEDWLVLGVLGVGLPCNRLLSNHRTNVYLIDGHLCQQRLLWRRLKLRCGRDSYVCGRPQRPYNCRRWDRRRWTRSLTSPSSSVQQSLWWTHHRMDCCWSHWQRRPNQRAIRHQRAPGDHHCRRPRSQMSAVAKRTD